jgi:hypothetical protein
MTEGAVKVAVHRLRKRYRELVRAEIAETETISLARGEATSLQGPSEFPCEFGGYRLLGFLGRGGSPRNQG